jgi:16S rRNA (uracil1498-N3)-methyltransferase
LHRFYFEGTLPEAGDVELTTAISHHIQVLRLEVGNNIALFDQGGQQYDAQIVQLSKRSGRALIGKKVASQTESPLHITIVQALSAPDRMDYTVQKATELGVNEIRVVISAFCSHRLAEERIEKKLLHWRNIAISAAEQSGRTRFPKVGHPETFNHWLSRAEVADIRLLLSPIEGKTVSDLTDQAQSAIVLIGPEGGFSPKEEADAISAGYTPLKLGPRVVRTETVAPVISALLQAKYGDF